MNKKERACLATAKWIKKNPEYHPAYFKSPAGKKANTLNGWRQQDHHHVEVPTGSTNIREGTICKRCNILRG